MSVPGSWNDLERDPRPLPVGSPSGVKPPSFARPPFLSTPGKRVEVGGGACSISRSRRVIANVCVAPALFTKPCHVYRLLFIHSLI